MSDEHELGFTGQHYSDDERKQEIYASHQVAITVMRREYRARLIELAKWYEHRKEETFSNLARELEALHLNPTLNLRPKLIRTRWGVLFA